jgi:hypothetical protein
MSLCQSYGISLIGAHVRSATSASSINFPEFDVMLRAAARGAPAVLPELLEERLAIGLIELTLPAWACVYDVRRLPGTTLDGFPGRSGGRPRLLELHRAVANERSWRRVGASAATASANIVLPPSRPLRTKARTELPRALAQACLRHGNPAEVVSQHRHRFG